MRVYVITKYWDNDEGYPEDFTSTEGADSVFLEMANGIEYLRTLTVGNVFENTPCNMKKDKWYIDEVGEIQYNEDGSITREFHGRTPVKDGFECYYEEATIRYTMVEMEVRDGDS